MQVGTSTTDKETCLQQLLLTHNSTSFWTHVSTANLVYKWTPADNSDGATLDSSPHFQGRQILHLAFHVYHILHETSSCTSAKALEYRFFFTIDVHSWTVKYMIWQFATCYIGRPAWSIRLVLAARVSFKVMNPATQIYEASFSKLRARFCTWPSCLCHRHRAKSHNKVPKNHCQYMSVCVYVYIYNIWYMCVCKVAQLRRHAQVKIARIARTIGVADVWSRVQLATFCEFSMKMINSLQDFLNFDPRCICKASSAAEAGKVSLASWKEKKTLCCKVLSI